MKSVVQFLLALLLIEASAACFPLCKFKFCSDRQTFTAGTPDKSITGAICAKDGTHIGHVGSTGEAFVVDNRGRTIRISHYAPKGLKQHFSPSFFKSFDVPSRLSGIGHETLQANQKGFLKNLCVAVPLTSYQILNRNNHVVDNVHAKNPLRDCVALRVNADSSRHTPSPPREKESEKPISSKTPTPTPLKVAEVSAPPSTPASASPSPSQSSQETSTTVPTPSSATLRPTPVRKRQKPSSGPGLGSSVNLGDIKPGATARFQKNIVIAKRSFVKEDLYLLTDITTSMSGVLSTVRSRFEDIIKARSEASTDVAFGLGVFHDEIYSVNGFEFGFKNLVPITKDLKRVRTAVRGLDVLDGGNVDFPEGGLFALHKVATSSAIQWRKGSRKIIAFFSDNTQHEPSCVSGKVITRESVIRDLKTKGITLIWMDVGSFSSADLVPSKFKCSGTSVAKKSQGSTITAATGGALLNSPGTSEIVDNLNKAVGALNFTVSADVSDCTNKYIVQFTPSLPKVVAPGARLLLTQSVSVKKSACKEADTKCVVKFSASGGSLASQIIKASTIDGC